MGSLLIEDPRDPILNKPTEPWDFENPPEPLESMVRWMGVIMNDKAGLGLSANQIGKPWSIFIMRWEEEKQIKVFINPKIVNLSQKLVLMEEGCLSYPGLWTKIKRPDNVRIRAANINGEVDTYMLGGLSGRVAQHEMDHLDGTRWYGRASNYHFGLAKNQKKKLDRARKRNELKVPVKMPSLSFDEIITV